LSFMIAKAQTGHNYPTPPEPMDPQSRKTEQPQVSRAPHRRRTSPERSG
jgi:hypothetical protein